jgi:hypothetical protein
VSRKPEGGAGGAGGLLRNQPAVIKLAELQAQLGPVCGFAEFLATLHALRFTGTVELRLLNGQPQAAALGLPIVVGFAEHPATPAPAADGREPPAGSGENLTGSPG